MRRGVLLFVLLALGVELGGVGFGATTAPATAAGGAGATDAQRVIVTLRAPHANETGLGLRARAAQRATIANGTDAVDSIVHDQGGRVVHRFHSVPYVAVEATPAVIARLRRAPAVAAVIPDTPLPAADAESTPLVGATATQAGGIDGSGQAIAILDTGVDKTHPFLAGKVVDEACFAASMTCPNGRAVQIGTGAAAPCLFAPSDCRHGTHVAGIAAGGPALGVPFTGVAPGAKLVAVQVFSRFVDPVCSTLHEASPCALTLPSDMLAGLEHVYDVAAQYHVASVNMSIGGAVHTAPCDTNVLKPAIDNLRAVNVATVIAAGNDGRPDAIAEPACISSAVRVGATTKDDVVATYSNSASFLRLLAPGSGIRSSVPGGGYADFSGTSMATPHVAGAFALAREAYPTETVAQTFQRFVFGGVPVTDARNGLTFRRLDVRQALGVVSIVPGAATTPEGSTVHVPVSLSRGSTLPVTASYQTLSYTAIEGVDFVGASGTVTFAPGTTAATVTITTLPDAFHEGDEILLVAFSAPTNASIGGFLGLGGGIIIDDD
jgi:subtilisin family serine protease